MTDDEEIDEVLDGYEWMLDQVDAGIIDLVDRIRNEDIEDKEIERLRVDQLHTLGYLLRTRRQIFKDRSLVNLSDRIDALRDDPDTEPVHIGPERAE